MIHRPKVRLSFYSSLHNFCFPFSLLYTSTFHFLYFHFYLFIIILMTGPRHGAMTRMDLGLLIREAGNNLVNIRGLDYSMLFYYNCFNTRSLVFRPCAQTLHSTRCVLLSTADLAPRIHDSKAVSGIALH